jgi:hypothetical protein
VSAVMNIRFHKILGISSVAEDLLASISRTLLHAVRSFSQLVSYGMGGMVTVFTDAAYCILP